LASQRQRAASEIFHAAIVRKGAAREAFLSATCQFDPSLRTDVDHLIAEYEAATGSDTEPVGSESNQSYAYAGTFPVESTAAATVGLDKSHATAALLESPAVAPPLPSTPRREVIPPASGESPTHHSLVMTIAWMVIGFAVLLIAAITLLNWLRG